MINPIVNLFEKKVKMPRGFATFTSIILVIALTAGIVTLLIAEIISGTNYLITTVPTYFNELVNFIEDWTKSQVIPLYEQLSVMFKTLDEGQQQSIINQIENAGTTIATTVSNIVQEILGVIPDVLKQLPNAATVIIFSLLATFFISKDWHKLTELAYKFAPSKVKSSSKSIFSDLRKASLGFIRAQLLLISITAVIVLIGLLVLRIDHAVTIAIIIGAVDLLPYLGTGLIFVPWIIYAFVTKQFYLTIGLSILYGVVILQRQLMEPKVLSSSIGLDPLATLIALFVGFQLFGFIGLIIGPVALVILKTLHTANVFEDLWEFIIGKKV